MKAIGLIKEGGSLLAALVKKRRRGFEIISLKSHEGENVKPLYKGIQFASPLGVKEVLIKEAQIKTGQTVFLKKALPFQAAALSAIEEENLIWTAVLSKSKKLSNILFHLTSNAALEGHLEEYKEFDPFLVTSKAQALFRFSEFSSFGDGIAIYFGMEEVILIKKQNGLLKGSCQTAPSLGALVEALIKSKKLSKEEALAHLKSEPASYSHKNEELSIAIKKVKEELKEGLHFLSKEKAADKIFVCGHAAKNFKSLFERGEIFFAEESLSKHSLAIGCALDLLASNKKSLQFRKGKYCQKRFLKMSFLKAAVFILGSAMSALALHLTFVQLCFQKEKELHSTLTRLREEDFNSHRRSDSFLSISSDLEIDLGRFEESLITAPDSHVDLTPKAGEILDLLKSTLPKASLKCFIYDAVKGPNGRAANVEVELEKISDSEIKTAMGAFGGRFAGEVKAEAKDRRTKLIMALKKKRGGDASSF